MSRYGLWNSHVDGLTPDCSNSTDNALELLQSCAKPSMCDFLCGLAYKSLHPSQSVLMASSNGNIFRVTGALCGEFTGHRRIPLTKAGDGELWCFLWSAPSINNREAGDLRRNRAHYDVIGFGVCIFLVPGFIFIILVCVVLYQWFSARLQYPQCVSNGVTAVLPKTIVMISLVWELTITVCSCGNDFGCLLSNANYSLSLCQL